MAEIATLKVDVRTEVTKPEKKRLIKNGYLIGNISRKGTSSVPVALKKDEFRRTLKKFGRNCVIKLESPDKKSYDVMVKTIQISPVNYDYYHVDFQQVSLTENVKADAAIRYTGIELLESKRLILNRLMDAVPVSGLPQNIPDFVEFDVSNLKAGDDIYVHDLKFPEEIKPEIDDKHLVASIFEAKLQEEEKEEEEEETEDKEDTAKEEA